MYGCFDQIPILWDEQILNIVSHLSSSNPSSSEQDKRSSGPAREDTVNGEAQSIWPWKNLNWVKLMVTPKDYVLVWLIMGIELTILDEVWIGGICWNHVGNPRQPTIWGWFMAWTW